MKKLICTALLFCIAQSETSNAAICPTAASFTSDVRKAIWNGCPSKNVAIIKISGISYQVESTQCPDQTQPNFLKNEVRVQDITDSCIVYIMQNKPDRNVFAQAFITPINQPKLKKP